MSYQFSINNKSIIMVTFKTKYYSSTTLFFYFKEYCHTVRKFSSEIYADGYRIWS